MSNRISIEVITPRTAEQYMKRNSGNRPIHQRTVRKYTEDMANGRWMVSSQGIGFDTNGRLVDGQHRLLACIASGVSFTTVVAHGLAPEVFKVIDTHDKRSGGQIATIAGIPNGNASAALLNSALLFENTAGKASMAHSAIGHISDATKVQLLIDNNDAIQRSLSIARAAYTSCRVLTPSLLGGLHYLVSKTMPEKADEFVYGVGSGEGLMLGDPRLTLRNRMIERAAKIHKERFEWVAVLHIYAWNAYAHNRPLKKLLWRSGDTVPKLIR